MSSLPVQANGVAPIRVLDPVTPRPARIASRPGRLALQLLGVAAVGASVLVNVVDPYSGVAASEYFTVALEPGSNLPSQSVTSSSQAASIVRDGFTVTEPPKPTPTPTPTPAPAETPAKTGGGGGGYAPPAAAPDPGSAQAIAAQMVADRGWPSTEYDCLYSLWSKESGWRYNAYNAGSGAYGIPQSLPGSKMASAGADWETNPATQITWGLGYITGRYETPCGAWGHSQSSGWY
ncbi:lytic transglycosylase domain-containing protein [Agreia sp. VKM Ac-1783]|uniref:aggregation-promoting factor C-terminal-like domain-containing protein n=1 Tax=Agreia sp. VKM Ac-1783 TaxID=1938889 RepID=UPI002016975C|nr:lytic transglycosylase domain-containing protein [Agreia sp. VKM Ac-1783]